MKRGERGVGEGFIGYRETGRGEVCMPKSGEGISATCVGRHMKNI